MKLAQRLVLSYYHNKLKTIALVSPRAAAMQAFTLFCTPYSKRKSLIAPPVFTVANKLTLDFAGFTIKGFRWAQRNSGTETKRILIVHGFDSHSYRFDKYIDPLLKMGFEVLAFDGPAHGLSSGKTITVDVYRDLIIHVEQEFGKLYGVLAHSLGALAASLAVEKTTGALCEKLVLISPSTETTRAIDTFFKYLRLSKQVRNEFENIIKEKGGHPANWYSVARAVQTFTTPTLWVHDSEDTVTPFEDMSYLIKQSMPHLSFSITKGLGHSPYRDEKVAETILSFLQLN